MFDLTKQIKLDPMLQKKYAAARVALHVFFVVGALFVADRILLPVASQDYYFNNINSTKNTLSNPRVNDSPTLSNGVLAPGDKFSFNSSRMGVFSTASITLNADKNTKDLPGTALSVRKSYQAFFFPLGAPMGFKNGTLLTTADGSYYIVSDDTLRKFVNTDIILQFGFPKSAFLNVSPKDLIYNTVGPDITTSNTYPDGSLFAIGDAYYQLKNQQLLPFISERAFLSQYDAIDVIPKDQDFFASYPAGSTSLGFADGTLASANGSVFILSEGKSYPVANADTFVSMGFDWNNVIPLETEELGFYQQQKQFTQNQPHPDGTLFVDQKNQQYFVIENGKRLPILSSAIVKTYDKQKPVLADGQSLEKSVSCSLATPLFTQNTYSCNAPLADVNQFPGNYYQIDMKVASSAKITQMNVTLSTPATIQNLRKSLGAIRNTLSANYIQ